MLFRHGGLIFKERRFAIPPNVTTAKSWWMRRESNPGPICLEGCNLSHVLCGFHHSLSGRFFKSYRGHFTSKQRNHIRAVFVFRVCVLMLFLIRSTTNPEHVCNAMTAHCRNRFAPKFSKNQTSILIIHFSCHVFRPCVFV